MERRVVYITSKQFPQKIRGVGQHAPDLLNYCLLSLEAISQKSIYSLLAKKMAALRILGQPFSLFMLFDCYLEYIILPSNFLPSSKDTM